MEKLILLALILAASCTGDDDNRDVNTDYIGDPTERLEQMSDSIDSVKAAHGEMPYQQPRDNEQ